MNLNESHILNHQQQAMNALVEEHYTAQDEHYVHYMMQAGIIPLTEYTPIQKRILFNQLSIMMAQGYHTKPEWREHMQPILAKLGITHFAN